MDLKELWKARENEWIKWLLFLVNEYYAVHQKDLLLINIGGLNGHLTDFIVVVFRQIQLTRRIVLNQFQQIVMNN